MPTKPDSTFRCCLGELSSIGAYSNTSYFSLDVVFQTFRAASLVTNAESGECRRSLGDDGLLLD